jgi:hypothetical protein
MNVLIADGDYYQSERRLISSIEDQLWYLKSETPGDMEWLPPHNIIRQSSHFKDYDEFLWYITAKFRTTGDYTLILDKERPGTEIHLLSPIYMNHPSRLSDLTRRGVTLNF